MTSARTSSSPRSRATSWSSGRRPADSFRAMDTRTLARAIAVGRLGFGTALVVAPRLLTAGWVGADARRAGVKAVATGLGARDLALAAGVLCGLSRGGAQPWVVASAAADL